MRWRLLLAVLFGLLLMLPLAWLFYVAMFGQSLNAPGTQTKGPVPMLSPEERRSLLTYERSCKSDTDCEPPLRCFFSTRSMSRYCSDSRCVTDMQCKEGFACRTQTPLRNRDPIRVCSLVGVRKEGEDCMAHASTLDYACGPGLLCNSRCGRPCELEDPSSCPEGFFCHEGSAEGPSCLPTCEGRTCAEGQQCVALDNPVLEGRHASICATVYGQDCKQNPCPQGQDCRLHAYPEPRMLCGWSASRFAARTAPHVPRAPSVTCTIATRPVLPRTRPPASRASPVTGKRPRSPGGVYRRPGPPAHPRRRPYSKMRPSSASMAARISEGTATFS